MNCSSVGRSAKVLSLALLVVALASGVPVQGHTHHDDDTPHIGAPGHGHGLVLVEHEMRLERADAPVFVPPEAAILLNSPVMRPSIVDLGVGDDDLCESRAPPTCRPRAPPA